MMPEQSQKSAAGSFAPTGSGTGVDTSPAPLPPRPRSTDRAIIAALAAAAINEIIEWFDDAWREERRDKILADLTQAFQCSRDGYHRARFLGDKGWFCDSELVEILGGWDGYNETIKAVRAWVAANGITPELGVGQRVEITIWNMPDKIGTITWVHTETAEYIVQTDAWLTAHPLQPPTSGYLIAYENVRAIESVEAV